MSDCPKCQNTGISPLRRAITAPPGHVIVVRDLSAIEARVNAWLCGQEDMVDIFRRGECAYCDMYKTISGVKITKRDKNERFLGKTVVLGCLGPGTLVLTNQGYKRIIEVTNKDMVWDGEEWVNHQGVIAKGQKTVQTAYGLTATADHEILTEHGWKGWSEVLQSPSHFQSALSKANLPSSVGNDMYPLAERQVITQSFGALVVGRDESNGKILSQVGPPDATIVQNYHPPQQENIIGGMNGSCQKNPIELGSSTESPLVSEDVTTKRADTTETMGNEASMSLRAGEKIESSSSNTSSHSQDGMTQPLSSTGSTTTEDMNPKICDLFQGGRILETEEPSESCKLNSTHSQQKIETFDIAFAGPRNRFTVMTEFGPILVHNCGYGLGWKKFQSMLRVGMLGDKGRLLGWDIAAALGVNIEGFHSKNVGWLSETLPPGVDFDVHTVHCACAAKIIQTFRDNKPMIPKFWDRCQQALPEILAGGGTSLGTNDVIKTTPKGFLLPNGMTINYVELQGEKKGRRIEYSILKDRKRGERAKVYGGLCTENLVQALSRIILTDAMLKMHREGIRVCHQVHDEILVVAIEAQAEQVYHRMGEIMSIPPKWAPDLPLASEGGYSHRYIK